MQNKPNKISLKLAIGRPQYIQSNGLVVQLNSPTELTIVRRGMYQQFTGLDNRRKIFKSTDGIFNIQGIVFKIEPN